MSNCGCVYCKGQHIPTTRSEWKGLQNRHHHTVGVHQKGGHHRKIRQAH